MWVSAHGAQGLWPEPPARNRLPGTAQRIALLEQPPGGRRKADSRGPPYRVTPRPPSPVLSIDRGRRRGARPARATRRSATTRTATRTGLPWTRSSSTATARTTPCRDEEPSDSRDIEITWKLSWPLRPSRQQHPPLPPQRSDRPTPRSFHSFASCTNQYSLQFTSSETLDKRRWIGHEVRCVHLRGAHMFDEPLEFACPNAA